MGLAKGAAGKDAIRRQGLILKRVSEPDGVTGGRLSKELGVARGQIVRDIAALRRKGYPIQVSSMKTEDGMYQAVYELPKYRPV